MKLKLLILLGPTAVGKSKLAIELAQKFNGEIISADSMQVYRGMDIGTDKPSHKLQATIPHHLIDIKNPDEDYSVAEFLDLAKKNIAEIHSRNKLPIIVGGTGMYLAALIEGFSLPIIKANPALRQRLEAEAKSEGIQTLYNRLKKIDPAAAQKIHPNDKRRIIRALEVYELTGMPISKLQKKESFIKEYNTVIIGLNMERDKLYKRIEERIDKMIDYGLIEEVKKIVSKYGKNLKSFKQALGYKEVIAYLDGKYPLEETIQILKKNTRNFARRQMTWFRRFKNVKWFMVDKDFDIKAIITYVQNFYIGA